MCCLFCDKERCKWAALIMRGSSLPLFLFQSCIMMAHHMNSLSVWKVLRDLYSLPGTPRLKTEEDAKGGWVRERWRRKLRKLSRRWDLRLKPEPSRLSQESALSQDQQGTRTEEGRSLQEDSIQIFALLGSREIRDKTSYKIFRVLIRFSLKRMTIEICTYE